MKPISGETATIGNRATLPINWGVMEKLGMDLDFIPEVVEILGREIPDNMESIRRALRQDDWDELTMVAHRVKGSVAYVGAEPAQEAAVQLENAARNQNHQVALKWVVQLEAKIDELMAFLARPDWMTIARERHAGGYGESSAG